MNRDFNNRREPGPFMSRDRGDRNDRGDRSDRGDRVERGERGERGERSDNNRFDYRVSI